MKVNPYTSVNYIKPTTKNNNIQKTEKADLSRDEIISSKDLSPEQKMEMLGIKPMSIDELAEGLTTKILGD